METAAAVVYIFVMTVAMPGKDIEHHFQRVDSLEICLHNVEVIMTHAPDSKAVKAGGGVEAGCVVTSPRENQNDGL